MKKLNFIPFIIVILLSSCSYLDIDDKNLSNQQVAFSNPLYVQQMCFNVYSYIPGNFTEVGGATLAAACDEADLNNRYSPVQSFNNGTWGEFHNPEDKFAHLYAGIRAANLFLNGTRDLDYTEYKFADPERYEYYSTKLNEYKVEVRFLRAYFYFELIKRYGGVPIIEDVKNIGDDIDLVRNSYIECVEFINSELNQIAGLSRKVAEDGYMGRVTTGAVYALKCRLFLYAASPLHNNGNYNLNYCDSSANAFVKIKNLGIYDLNLNYRNTFLTQTSINKEIIFDRRMPSDNILERNNYPLGGAPQFAYNVGQNATCPSQNLVDAYEMKDGTTFSWSNPVHADDPYLNRDPRFYETIITNGTSWNDAVVESFEGGKDGIGKNNATSTGYYLKKSVNEKVLLRDNRTAAHVFHIFRYGEMLLNYAEAMNELYGPTSPYPGTTMSALDAINSVRARTGVQMPPIGTSVSKSELRERIRNERRIELAFENHRFWDVRRWQIAEQTENTPLYGMKITIDKYGSEKYNPSYVVEKRVFEAPKMYFYPIQNNEIVKYKKFKQTQYWD